jgi:2-keto-4-pentenoate hydratase
MCLGQVSPEVCILKETKSKVSCLDLGKLADQMYNKKNVNIAMSNNITHAVEGELFLLLFSITFF